MSPLILELSADGVPSVRFVGGPHSGPFHVSRDAVKGLWSAPAVKTSLTERQTGDGAFPVADVLYSARTVTIPFNIVGDQGMTLDECRDSIGRFMGLRGVRLTVCDGDGRDSYVIGYVAPEYSDMVNEHSDTGSITLVCPDPRRYSVDAYQSMVNTSGETGGGLNFGEDGKGLVFPIDFGASVNNSVTNMANMGSYKAYPTFTLNGDIDDGARIAWATDDGRNGEIAFGNPVGFIPVTLDCERRSAVMGGLDVSYLLSASSWPYIRPDGTLTVRLLATGTGWLTVQSHDVWM